MDKSRTPVEAVVIPAAHSRLHSHGLLCPPVLFFLLLFFFPQNASNWWSILTEKKKQTNKQKKCHDCKPTPL